MRVHIPCLDKTVRREMIEPIVSRNERHNEKTENQQINTKQQGVAAGGNDRNYAQAMRRDEVYIVGGMGEVKLKYLGDDMVLLNGIKKEEVTQGTRVEDQEWSRNFKWGRAQDLQCLVLIEMMLIKRLKEKEKECSKGGPGEVTFPKVKVRLKLGSVQRNIPHLTQVGPMLVTHWELSGPVVLRLSAWGARFLFSSGYKDIVIIWVQANFFVDFIPDLQFCMRKFEKQEVLNSCPPEFGITKRFWSYVLERKGLRGDILWASISNSSLMSIDSLLKDCIFDVTGKILNVDGVTGGFNFQNAWSGGFIAGTTIGGLALGSYLGSK
ncbi:hypothetical protein JHK84_035891 [Glycine max]|nr:hypothetical protein JHK86_035613 [Glycine max]KAG5129494.1 hypothetical protein JHK84_035891 [Glycine max]